MRSGFFTALTIALLLPTIASAQSIDGSLMNTDPFTISVSPQYPAPLSRATLSFLSSTLTLSNATLTVSSGGKNVYKGSVQPVTISLGKAGSVANILVTLSSGGSAYSRSVVIQPQDVALIAEPLSSAPVLYPGKPSVPLGGDVRVVAVANLKDAGGKTLDPSSLSYAWTVDGTQIADSSGIGRAALTVAAPLQYRERTVSVTVESQSGSLVGGASLSLSSREPSVRVYANDPLLGIRFDHALSNSYAISGAEMSLFAVPFSFPTTGGAPLVQWFLNGAAAQAGNSITLRPAGSGQGSAALSLTTWSGNSSRVSEDLSLTFGAKPSSNFFGL